MIYFVKYIIKFFAPKSTSIPLLTQHEQFVYAQTIFRTYYVIIFFFSFTNWTSYLGTTAIIPLWPLYWVQYVGIDFGIKAISLLYFVTCLLAVIFPGWRVSRILVFLGLLEFRALGSSFGKIGSEGYLTLLLSFFLIFLPSGWLSRNFSKYVRTATLIIFSTCQVLMMMTYTMSGIGKLIGVFIQSGKGEIHALVPKGLSLTIAASLLRSDSTSFLGAFFINHYYVAWLLMIGTIYLQFFSLWAAFRPTLHQLWGIGLIFFHISTSLTINVSFPEHTLWLAIFFLGSPFRPKKFSWSKIFQDLPLIGQIPHWFQLIIPKILRPG